MNTRHPTLTIIAFASLMLLALAPGTLAASPVIKATIRFNPDPIAAGSAGHMFVDLSNSGDESASSMEVTISSAPEGLVFESTLGYFGQVGKGQTATKGFAFTSDPEMPTGTYILELTLSYRDGTDYMWLQRAFTFAVDGVEVLAVDEVRPATFLPGVVTTLDITVHSDRNLTNARLQWSVEEDAIVPFGGAAEVQIGRIEAGTQHTIEIPAVVDATTPAGAYHLYLTFLHSDDAMEHRSEWHDRLVYVSGETTFEVATESRQAPEWEFLVANSGIRNAIGVSVEASGAVVTSANPVFIGSLDAGDFTSVDFSSAGGAIQRLTIDYTDTGGLRRTVTVDLDNGTQMAGGARGAVVPGQMAPGTGPGQFGGGQGGRGDFGPNSQQGDPEGLVSHLVVVGAIATLVLVGLVFAVRFVKARREAAVEERLKGGE